MTRSSADGTPLTDTQEAIAACYDTLLGVLRDRRDELAPFEERGVTKALAALWHVVNGLDLEPELLYDIGV